MSQSFGFVIVLMPIFGLFLVVANIIDLNQTGTMVAKYFKDIGNLLFSNIGMWFALAIVIGFANNKGVAIYGTIIFYLIFTITNSALIQVDITTTKFNILFWKDLQLAIFTTKAFGFTTFNSGVFGGLVCGTIMILVYNHLKNTKLPRGLEFFGGERFVLIIIPLFAVALAICFAIVWPLLGKGLLAIGEVVAKSPQGLDAFIFRMVQRMFIPFGTGMLWQAPIWYTNIGGSIVGLEGPLLATYLQRLAYNGEIDFSQAAYNYFYNLNISNLDSFLESVNKATEGYLFEYATKITSWVEGAKVSDVFNAVGDQFLALKVLNTSGGLLIQDLWTLNIRASRFVAPGFSNSIFVLPTMATIMYFRIPKAERKNHLGMFINATLTTMLLGVTEPIELLFCYTAPVFFFLIYSPLNGLIGLFTSIFEIKAGTAFSTGLIDFTFSGIIPWFTGNDTRFYLVPIIGVVAAGLLGVIAYFWFRKINFSPIKLNLNNQAQLKANISEMTEWFGKYKNISSIKLNHELLEVELKKPININDFNKWFDNIESQKNNQYCFKIKADQKIIVETFFESIMSKKKFLRWNKMI
ncbi:PTS transporter subunit EIIC [Spiroplasma clarkii]|uniref:PTS transporter subunit EIIC n=1 Tax=Spiroplasma clarkii TaxID=2139 RepID=UPI00214FF2C9|nr:PTS transporter subunit EIIC [Spiroplasma clarkii]